MPDTYNLAGYSQAVNTLEAPLGPLAHDWEKIWIYPAWGSVAVLVVFMIFFRQPAKKAAKAEVQELKTESLEII